MPTHAWVILATVSWGIWAFALRKAVSHMPPLAAYVAYGLTSLLLVPVYVLFARAWNSPLKFPLAGTAWSVAAATLVAFGVVAMMYAMRGEDASKVVALTASYPLVTLLLAVVFLEESFTATRAVGILAIAAGAYLVSR